jgi:hypothetical protein
LAVEAAGVDGAVCAGTGDAMQSRTASVMQPVRVFMVKLLDF